MHRPTKRESLGEALITTCRGLVGEGSSFDSGKKHVQNMLIACHVRCSCNENGLLSIGESLHTVSSFDSDLSLLGNFGTLFHQIYLVSNNTLAQRNFAVIFDHSFSLHTRVN